MRKIELVCLGAVGCFVAPFVDGFNRTLAQVPQDTNPRSHVIWIAKEAFSEICGTFNKSNDDLKDNPGTSAYAELSFITKQILMGTQTPTGNVWIEGGVWNGALGKPTGLGGSVSLPSGVKANTVYVATNRYINGVRYYTPKYLGKRTLTGQNTICLTNVKPSSNGYEYNLTINGLAAFPPASIGSSIKAFDVLQVGLETSNAANTFRNGTSVDNMRFRRPDKPAGTYEQLQFYKPQGVRDIQRLGLTWKGGWDAKTGSAFFNGSK